jgi:hypothetical protein
MQKNMPTKKRQIQNHQHEKSKLHKKTSTCTKKLKFNLYPPLLLNINENFQRKPQGIKAERHYGSLQASIKRKESI